MEEHVKKVLLKIPFENGRNAALACDVLSVDSDIKGSGTAKTVYKEENHLYVKLEGTDFKKLRVAVNGFIKNLLLVVKTINQFDNPNI